MRRITILLLCAALLVGAVYADNRADTVRNDTTILPDGSARVMLTVTVRLEEPVEDLKFPLPRGADNVTLNGANVETSRSRDNDSVDLVDLGYLDGVTGVQDLLFGYTLPQVVDYEEEADADDQRDLILSLPLLSGFDYPVEAMSFSVALPEGVEGIPSFYSGYFLQSIESDLTYHFADGMITGKVTEVMKDKETLMMTIQVTQEQFPELVIIENEENIHLYAMAALTALALVFWLIFLPSLPVFSGRQGAVPMGIHAGEVGSRLTMEGGDLTMLVFQWAQLGYIRIVPDRRERVWLHKRMEMGNERSDFEVRCFNQLFGKNKSVEGTGSRYDRLWHSVRANIECKDEITRGGLGARTVFRVLAALVSTLAGASMGMNAIEEGPWQIVLAVALAAAGSFTAWKIQAGFMKLHLRHREDLPGGLVCCLLWLAAGLLTDRPLAGVFSAAVQILAGIFTTWGGRRTKPGWQMACRILGLRRFLAGIRREEIKEELGKNPDYFFEMIPYAMAFGVENRFAGRFGTRIMPQCSYMDAERASKRTAREWTALMRQTAEKMDAAGRAANTYRKVSEPHHTRSTPRRGGTGSGRSAAGTRRSPANTRRRRR